MLSTIIKCKKDASMDLFFFLFSKFFHVDTLIYLDELRQSLRNKDIVLRPRTYNETYNDRFTSSGWT